MISKRKRTPSSDIGHALYLYFLGLSTRCVAKAMFFLHKVRRSHVAIWLPTIDKNYKFLSSMSIEVDGLFFFVVVNNLFPVEKRKEWI
jgi:hypothetical protein